MRDLSIDTGYFPSLSFLEDGKTNNSFFTVKFPRLRYELLITKNRVRMASEGKHFMTVYNIESSLFM